MIEWCSAAGVSIGGDFGNKMGGIKARSARLEFRSLEGFGEVEGEFEE